MSDRILTGTMSVFGGPEDTGVSPSEGLALCEPHETGLFPPDLFLPAQPPNTTGLARKLNPLAPYIATRWNYEITPRSYLQGCVVIVTNPVTGKSMAAQPIDWGPNESTGRIADLSPGLAEALELETDAEVLVKIPLPPKPVAVRYGKIVISSGHGLKVRGASGVLDEVDEARRVVEAVAEELRGLGVDVKTFHDNTSTTQNQNLHTIVNYHNKQSRDLDVSVHFNAFEDTSKPMGTECLYVSQSSLANQIAAGVAKNGFINRGGKKRTDLFFLNNTSMPSILAEVCFVDSDADSELYRTKFGEVCRSIALVLTGAKA